MEQPAKIIATLHQLLRYEADRFMAAEIQLKNHLSEWISQATSFQLKATLQRYAEFTNQHINKLESFLQKEEGNASAVNDRVMRSFIEETDEKLRSCADMEVKDACLLSSIQCINHYKISVYGSCAAFSGKLNLENDSTVFHEMEVNEKQIDDRLSQLAEHEINMRASSPIVIEK